MEKNWKYEDEELLEKEFQAQVMEMKQKYEEIPVPAHARDRMLAGIRQAKEEKERSVSGVISLEDRKGRKNMKVFYKRRININKNIEKIRSETVTFVVS